MKWGACKAGRMRAGSHAQSHIWLDPRAMRQIGQARAPPGDCRTAWLFAHWGPFGRQRRTWPHAADSPHVHTHRGKIGRFFEVWVFSRTQAELCGDGPHKTAGDLQNTPGTPAIHFSLVAAGSQSALYKPCRALEKDDWTMRESQAGLNWVLHAEEVGSGICDTMCMNVGARTWARMGSCARRCWAELLCCHGSGLCRGGGALGSRDATVYAEALN